MQQSRKEKGHERVLPGWVVPKTEQVFSGWPEEDATAIGMFGDSVDIDYVRACCSLSFSSFSPRSLHQPVLDLKDASRRGAGRGDR